MRIGWFSNWMSFEYKRDSGVPKNIREIPILKELLRYGEIIWLGSNSKAEGTEKPGIINFGGIYTNIPKYDSSRWNSSAEYIRDVAVNYPSYRGKELPDVDAVFVRSLPSFIYENAKIYIMLYQYGLRGIPVFVRDLELIMLKKLLEGSYEFLGKPFGISGADKVFTDHDWEIMSRNTIFINPVPKQANEILWEAAPHLKFESFFFPYDVRLYPPLKPGSIKYKVAYIGNDTGRRTGFKRYLEGLPANFAHIFGGQARQIGKEEKNFPKDFRDRFPNIKFHGVVPHYKVNKIYNRSAACMNIPKPIFSKVGFCSARFLEAVFSGAALCLPSDFRFANTYVDNTLIIKNSQDLRNVAMVLSLDNDLRIAVLKKQREILKDLSSVRKNVERVLSHVHMS